MKRVLITGAMSGIGLATTQLFLERDWTVFMTDKKKDSQILKILNDNYPEKVYFYKCNISKAREVQILHSKVQKIINGIDCIINNSGIITHGLLHQTEEKDWDEVMTNDVKSIYLTSKYFIPDLIKNKNGNIVNTASISGISADYEMPVYNAAKGAVINLTRAMALDYAQFNIRVNSVCPTVNINMLNSENLQKYSDTTPIKSFCNPVEIAKAVYFLASEESGYCTGVNIPINKNAEVLLQDKSIK